VPARFFGQPVELRLDTRAFPADEPPAPPTDAEFDLARLILAGLAGIRVEAERQYAEYNNAFLELRDKVHQPHVWISREWLAVDGPGHWSFVVWISDAPDWGLHLEFWELEFLRIWSGD
jgi:hypothetical protein